jgi:glycosyltransferase involved in cell wall biosynthesis
MKKIAILGTRGIPASYSGFETSVEETAIRFAKNGFDVTVFCRSNHYDEKHDSYKGVKLKYLSSIKTKHLDTVSNSILSIFVVAKEQYDIIIIYGIGNAYFIPFLKMFCKNIISVVDGADWERDKWSKFAKIILSTGRKFAVKFANNYIVDNELLASEYKRRFKKEPIFIPYGATVPQEYDKSILDKLGLESNKYIVFIGRYVKEKGIEFLIENFKKINTSKKLVLIGGNDTDKKYEAHLKKLKAKNVIHLGFIYGKEYEAVLKFAQLYVSGSFLEGTSPSLLSGMAINGFALVSDIPENIEVLKGTCATYKVGNNKDLQEKLSFFLENNELVESERGKTRRIVEENYSWEKITNQYIELF